MSGVSADRCVAEENNLPSFSGTCTGYRAGSPVACVSAWQETANVISNRGKEASLPEARNKVFIGDDTLDSSRLLLPRRPPLRSPLVLPLVHFSVSFFFSTRESSSPD